MGVLSGMTVANAAVKCVASSGVTQTETTVTGTSANDTIDCGGALPGKTVKGNGGNDTITGTVFVDSLNGGDGNDTITGAIANDILVGGNGNDTMTGSAGNDMLSGGIGDDTLTGSEGDDTLKGDDRKRHGERRRRQRQSDGGPGTDILRGDADADALTGPPGDLSFGHRRRRGRYRQLCEAVLAGPHRRRDVLVACNP